MFIESARALIDLVEICKTAVKISEQGKKNLITSFIVVILVQNILNVWQNRKYKIFVARSLNSELQHYL